jgi:RNA-directed DNA polymerase
MMIGKSRKHSTIRSQQHRSAEPDCWFSLEKIDAAYQWLCTQRRHYPAESDIWHLRFHWPRYRNDLFQALSADSFALSPQLHIVKMDGSHLHCWSSIDALVLQMLAWHLGGLLPTSKAYTHLKGHGGLKHTVRQVYDALPQYPFVCKTDVKAYYESIDHAHLLQQLSPFLPDKQVWLLIYHYVHRVVERGGNFSDINRGICRGCPLSPVMAALYLLPLDKLMTQTCVFYRRYMDDIIIFCKTRWQLRQAIALLNQQLSLLKLTKATDKTFIGSIDSGFSFLGYHFRGGLLQPAEKQFKNIGVG